MKSAAPVPGAADISQLVELFNGGRYAELEVRANSLLSRHPEYGLAWKLLSAALQLQGKEALAPLKMAVRFLPDDVDVRLNLGSALHDSGNLAGAAEAYRQALELVPDFAAIHNNFGTVLQDMGDFEGALVSYRRALELQPDFAEAHSNLGNALKAVGQLDRAVASYRRALEIKPDFADAHYNLGIVFRELGRLDEAVASYRKALESRPHDANIHYNLANALRELGMVVDAVHGYRNALALKPDFAEAHNNLGAALQDLGRLDDAMASYRRALALKPDYADAQGNILFALNFDASHSASYCRDQAREYGRIVAAKVPKDYVATPTAPPSGRLRVGMVSGDLRNHPVGYFLEGLLAQLDPTHIELIAYPTIHACDELTARIRPRFAAWKSLAGLSDAEAARLIRADQVHVLLDMSGHTAHNRLPLFAWRPAPVQATWLGYFASTGVAEMDYFLTDEVSVPESERERFTETVWYLPDTRLCFTPPDIDVPVSPLPAIENDYLTFGCFQNLAKVGDRVLVAWCSILAALPSARLRWQCKQFRDPEVVARCAQHLQQHGIDTARISLEAPVPRAAYLQGYAKVDVVLDTFPYTGGTTTCEALWMGVPTITLAGDTLLSRQGASLLSAAGQPDWVVQSERAYVAKAVGLAKELPELARLRGGLRAQVLASPLFDAPRFARNFEAALWEMWRRKEMRK